MKEAVVNKKAAYSLKEFFPWVYKSDILNINDFNDVEEVKIVDENGKFLAIGYINPKSVITIRVLDFKEKKIDLDFFIEKIESALEKRVDIESNAFRVVHSEADMLPGLIIDNYDENLSVFFNSAGILKYKNEILRAVEEVLTPKSIFISADLNSLEKEGITDFKEEYIGDIPKEIVIEENGVKFKVDIVGGQKTGFYLDQRKNREIVTKYIKQKSKVLDLFCNVGGFGLYASSKKDADVELVDISEDALNLAKENFKLNGKSAKFVNENVFDYLRVLRKGKDRYDMIIIDPPSFAKNKNQKKSAMRGFKDLVVNALKTVEDDGYIALFSCSYYVDMQDLKDIVLKASKDTKKRVQIVEHLYQDNDHPYILNSPYSLYLKGFLFKVV